ncbi:MAG TPA: FG-GAP-like repeat-containing protein [Pyrinomonadaceae bacterium]
MVASDPIPLSRPQAMVVDDFNNDGKADVAVANAFQAEISILLGNGNGTFASPIIVTAGLNILGIASADFNGDGKKDLVVGNGRDVGGEVAVVLGDGTGHFGQQLQIFLQSGTPNTVPSVATGDVNGDSKQDLVIVLTGFGSNFIYVMLGDGTGHFSVLTNYTAGFGQHPSLNLTDLNGDNKLDLVFINSDSTVATMLGDATGHFSTLNSFTVGNTPGAITIGDFSGDGKKDVAVANAGSDNVTVLLGDGLGGLGSATTIPDVGDDPQTIVNGDFDSDGTNDLIVISPIPGTATLFLNSGTGAFTKTSNFFYGSISGQVITSVTADFNQDNRPDLFVSNQIRNSGWVLIDSCGTAAEVQLTDVSYLGFENAGGPSPGVPGIVNPVVVRVGRITGPAQVNYETMDETAHAGQDYVPVSGTLHFNPGESYKIVPISLIDDNITEPTESFFFNLSHSLDGSDIGAPNGSRVTIIDDDVLVNAVVKFESTNVSVGEGSHIIFNVVRTNNLQTTVSVDYTAADASATSNCATVNGAASSRCDYLETHGTLTFAPDETSKAVSIPLVDDAYVEGDETFTVVLSNVVGGTLGTPSSMQATIHDNDSQPGPNPIDSPTFFIRQHYFDFLNREPDQSGLNFWVGTFTECGADQQCLETKRINASAAFFLSIEFQQTGYLVERIYKTAYGDALGTSTFNGSHQLPVPIIRLNEFLPDSQKIRQNVVVGQGDWEQTLEANKQAFVNEFVTRSRFTIAQPSSLTPTQFVDQLNTNAGSPLTPTKRENLINGLTGGQLTRAQVLRMIAEDDVLSAAELNRAFVLMEYFGYLRRNPNDAPDGDYTGYDFWLTKLNLFNGNFAGAEMVKAFIVAGEYRQRFGP